MNTPLKFSDVAGYFKITLEWWIKINEILDVEPEKENELMVPYMHRWEEFGSAQQSVLEICMSLTVEEKRFMINYKPADNVDMFKLIVSYCLYLLPSK